MKTLMISLVLILAVAQTVFAEEDLLRGVWDGIDRASESIYGKMDITAKEISWGGTNPYNPFCKTTYELVSTYTAATYPDNRFPLVAGRTFTIYKLRLGPAPCAKNERYILFALPSDKDRYAEVVTYWDDGQPGGWVAFSKAADSPKPGRK